MKKPTMTSMEKSKLDKARDKKMGYKEGSKADTKADKAQVTKPKK